MEAGLHIAEKTLEDLEKAITCAFCKEYYRDPKILPCLHYYCKECIRALLRKAGRDEPFCCPECHKNITLPEGGVDEFKSAFFIRRFKSMYIKNNLAFVRLTNREILHPSKYIEVNNVPKVAKVNREIKIEVVNSINTVTKSNLNLQCQIKNIPTEAVVTPEIVEKTSNRYDISFTPSVCGRYNLSVSAYGEPIPDSPFTVCMYMPPKRSDKPFNVWRGVTHPIGMAVNSVGEIVVAQFDGDIVVLNNEGKVLRCIEQSQHQVKWLESVAVDNEDNIYFISSESLSGDESSKIGKANKSGDNLLVRDTNKSLVDMAVIGDEVIVTEKFKGIVTDYRSVIIYDKELNYVRQVTTRDVTASGLLCPDPHGNLYTSDDENTIQVFKGVVSNKFLVYDQHMYVCVGQNRGIVVCNTEKEYVTTLGSYKIPRICADQNGVLYVADVHNDKIDCYQLKKNFNK